MARHFILILLGYFYLIPSFSQTYPDNESGAEQDMLSPLFYNSALGTEFRTEVNKFIYYARNVSCQHPLQDDAGYMPDFRVQRDFGDGMGPDGTSQHHPARDFYIGNRETEVNLYAMHDGEVKLYRDAPKYREYLSITKEIFDSAGILTGKMVSIYAHLDLEADEKDGLFMDGEYVHKGDKVSANLYANTVGGPHFHFEIRYYRPQDRADEEFYGLRIENPGFTEISSGKWSYGYWDPETGYGFGNPDNHHNSQISNIDYTFSELEIKHFPNPFNENIFLYISSLCELDCSVYDLLGNKIKEEQIINSTVFSINMLNYPDGFYFIRISGNKNKNAITLKAVKRAY